jgi:hypothetical protein
MSEWWTYSLSDFLLFSPRTYYRLFELYNAAIWPAQWAALALGLVVLGLLLGKTPSRGRLTAAILALCWLWVAWFYLLRHYATINWAANYFALGFAIESLLLFWTGAIHDRLRFRQLADVAGAGGCGMMVLAIAYPLIGQPLLGRPWTQAEVFGVVSDPTVIATLGVLTAAERPHWHLLVLPLIWCAIGGATLWTMQSPEAPVIPAVAAVAMALAVWKSLARAA